MSKPNAMEDPTQDTIECCDEPLVNYALTDLVRNIAFDYDSHIPRYKIIEEIDRLDFRLYKIKEAERKKYESRLAIKEAKE